jgi:cation/acetate symporter
VFIALLYTVAPAVGSMARLNITTTFWPGAVEGRFYDAPPLSVEEIETREDLSWIRNWAKTGLLKFEDKDGDGRIAYFNDARLRAPNAKVAETTKAFADARAAAGLPEADLASPEAVLVDGEENAELKALQTAMLEAIAARDAVTFGGRTAGELGLTANELTTVNNDIMVLANPEIARLPGWVVALVAAGGLAAALSTAAGLLLAISSAISHDLIKGAINPNLSERGELLAARISMAGAIALATYLGLNPPGFAAQVVALAFGLAAATIFPVLMMGIFSKRINMPGAVVGMIVGLVATAGYIFTYLGMFFIPGTNLLPNTPDNYLFGIAPASFGPVGALLNFVTAFVVSAVTQEPPRAVQELVESIRVPRGAGKAAAH